MKIFYRILLAVDAVFLSLISIVIMVSIINNQVFKNFNIYIEKDILTSTAATFVLFLFSFIFFCVNLSFLLSGLRTNKEKKAINKYTNIGEIKISLNTIENIVLATAKKVNGIRDAKAHVDRKNDNVVVDIKAVVMPEVDIPALGEDVQIKVKKSIEQSTGINVGEIKILVENIYTGYRSRVE